MNDLTIIYYTANRLNEDFAEKVREQLRIAASDYPLISMSKKPLNFGKNICEGNTKRSVTNIYKVILKGAKTAKTKYVAFAEDDTLYPPEHFNRYRPPDDIFGYNMTKWSMFTWSRPPFFSLKRRKTLSVLIAPRKLFVEAIEERFEKAAQSKNVSERHMWGEPGRGFEKPLGITQRKSANFFTYQPVVNFSHPEAIGFEYLGKRKRAGFVRALEIPYWGTAKEVMDNYYHE